MKKLTLLAACLFTISTVVSAQETNQKPTSTGSVTKTEKTKHEKLTPDQRAQKNVDELNATAMLTEDQKIKIKDLASARITKADAVRTQYKGQPENKELMQKEIAVIKKEYHQNVKILLTPEQQEKVKAKNKELKAAGKEASLDHD